MGFQTEVGPIAAKPEIRDYSRYPSRVLLQHILAKSDEDVILFVPALFVRFLINKFDIGQRQRHQTCAESVVRATTR